MKTFLFLLLALLPAVSLSAPDPRDSIILESKTVFPSNGPGALTIRVWITNKDTLSGLILPLLESSFSGGAYATLAHPRTFEGVVTVLSGNFTSGTANFSSYHSDSPDTFLLTGSGSLSEPPNSNSKAVWEIKFDSVLPNLGMVEFDTIKILATTVGFVDLIGRKVDVNFVKSIITVAAPKGDLNLDFTLTPPDVVFMLLAVFQGTPPPAGLAACDLDCDGEPTPADVVILLNMVFREESPPC